MITVPIIPRVRNRTRVDGSPGIALPLAVGLGPTPGAQGFIKDQSSDYIGNYPNPNPLYLDHFYTTRYWVTGQVIGWWDCKGYATSLGVASLGHNSPGLANPEPSDNTVLSRTLARTNPNAPKIDAPVFLWELKDIPQMLRDWGKVIKASKSFSVANGKNVRDLPKFAAKRYIEYQFGIAPFVSDMMKILDVVGNTDHKIRQLRNLGSPSPRSSAASVWSHSVSTGPWTDYATTLYQERRKVVSMYQTDWEKWGSTLWKPAISLPGQGSDDELNLARKLVFGLDISFSTLWEAMPWSWLIDWFSNAGDILTANRNTIPVTHGGSCVMKQTTSRSVYLSSILPLAGDSLAVTYPPYYRQTKERAVLGDASPRLEFSLPFFNGKQLSILAALAVLRR